MAWGPLKANPFFLPVSWRCFLNQVMAAPIWGMSTVRASASGLGVLNNSNGMHCFFAVVRFRMLGRGCDDGQQVGEAEADK